MEASKEKALLFTEGWNKELLNCLGETPGLEARELMHRCSDYHYRGLNMDQTLEPFVGDLPCFMKFLSGEWNWLITYEEEKRLIIANENKEFCVCPVVSAAEDGKVSPVICHCSEGFAKRMFEKVIGSEVKTEVISSILRGDKNCIYRIQF